MSPNQPVVGTYQASIGKLDVATVASCLAEDVERVEWADGAATSGTWVRGRDAVLRDLEAPGTFEIRAVRMTEGDNVVVAGCVVRVPLDDGGSFVGRCCSVCELENGQIRRMSSFLAAEKSPASAGGSGRARPRSRIL
jgi:ketosteroid isomerase-like protein